MTSAYAGQRVSVTASNNQIVVRAAQVAEVEPTPNAVAASASP